jgi:PAS domain S-box-containing protein
MANLSHITHCGLPGIDRIPVGMHACHFYSDREQLVRAVTPYAVAGLRENERCIWITAPPLPAREAVQALSAAWNGVDDAIHAGALRILDFDQWYASAGQLKGLNVVELWLEEEERALAEGYDGLRIAGNTSFVKPGDWSTFMEYENSVTAQFSGRRIVALCSYALDQCNGQQMSDVVDAHHCAFQRADTDWQMVAVAGVQSRRGRKLTKRLRRAMPLSSSERFRSALSAAKTVVWDLDLQSGQVVRSGSSLEVLGIPSGNSSDFARLVHPQDRPRVDAALAAAYAGESPYDIEFRITGPGSGLQWVHEIAEVHRNEAGQPLRLCGVTVDITARKQEEQELARYRMLSEHGRDIFLFIRTDGAIVDVNQAAVAAYGYSREELLGLPFQDLRAEATRAEIPAQMKRVMEQGPFRFETVHRRKDGTTFPVEASWSFANVGTDSVILSIVRDITERQRSEAALRGSELRFRTLADGAPALVWQDDAEGKTIYLNKTWEEFTGLPNAAGLGDGWSDLVHPEDRQRFRAAYFGAVDRREPYRAEYRMRRHDGAWRWVLDTATPLAAADGSIIGFIGLAVDITERKVAEERQQLLAREMDHRAKNVLTVVQSILQLSRADDVGSYINLAKGRIMALARAHSLLAESRWQGADLRRLVHDELAAYRTEKARITADGPAVTLTADASQSVALALHELATNAAKYGSLSQAKGRLAVEWRVEDSGLTLTWKETGGPTVAERPRRKGFGGLVIASSIEKQLQGRVTLKWLPEGLHVTVWLPAARVAETRAPASVDASAEPPRPYDTNRCLSLTGHRVLVVEDEPLVAMAIASALEDLGCTIIGPAARLEQALTLARGETFDAAVLDYKLAGLSSEPVAKLLRRRGIPFAVSTGYTAAGLPPQFGDAPLIAKPFEPNAIAELIVQLIDRQSAEVH